MVRVVMDVPLAQIFRKSDLILAQTDAPSWDLRAQISTLTFAVRRRFLLITERQVD